MNKKKLPLINAFDLPREKSRIDEAVFNRWNQDMKAAKEENNTITIYEVIGEDFFTGGGFTAKRMAAALRSIGKENDVVVSINSPGGDFFEGAAIYNLLREHEGNVTVKIIGLAASAASLIAMAGDTIQISDVGFYMIHDVWAFVCGNKNDLVEAADTFRVFDNALADVYAARTGYDRDEIAGMMDKDTWMNASDAIEKGFADGKLSDEIVDNSSDDEDKRAKALAKRSIEMALARDGFSRKERENILSNALGARDAAKGVARDADCSEEELKELLNIIKGG